MPSREEELGAPTGYDPCIRGCAFQKKYVTILRRGHDVGVFYILCNLMHVLNEAQPYMGFLY